MVHLYKDYTTTGLQFYYDLIMLLGSDFNFCTCILSNLLGVNFPHLQIVLVMNCFVTRFGHFDAHEMAKTLKSYSLTKPHSSKV